MTSIVIRRFDPDFAEDLTRLLHAAFAAAPALSRPRDTSAFVAHILGAANPAGAALVATARDDAGCLGAISGIPFRFSLKTGAEVTAFQLGYYLVHPRWKGRMLAKRLITSLIAELIKQPQSFVYGYPNRQSAGFARRSGMQPIVSVPTYVCPPTLAGMLQWGRQGGGRRLSFLSAHEAAEVALELQPRRPEPGVVRDAAFFRWRYCGPDADSRYRFVRMAGYDGGASALLVMTTHRAMKRNFAVLVDHLSADRRTGDARAVAWARGIAPRLGARYLYLTTNGLGRGPAGLLRGAWGVPVPERLNPRPITLYWYPEASAISGGELARCPVMTGDWMGF